jgi:type II secretory ATPase GspE/PulE/Tfp pilus assembly ATPase PilB-like protein
MVQETVASARTRKPVFRSGGAAATRVIGQLLLGSGAVTPEELESALNEQRRTRERLGEILVRRGTAAESVARALAVQLRLPFVEAPLEPRPDALSLVDAGLAARLRVVPLDANERSLRVAMADPLDARAIDDLQFQTGRRVEPVVAAPVAVDAALAAYHAGAVETILGRLRKRAAEPKKPDVEPAEVIALRRASEAPPIVALVDLVLARAAKARASDIHIEAAGQKMRVRARVDGVLRELLELPVHTAGALASRIKVMADMDISVKRRPQDGRATVRVDGRDLALRVSTLPALGGEKTVIRILDSSAAGPDLDGLGFDVDTRSRFNRLLGRSHGVILVTGPTGSGKTTTLYAALRRIDRESMNVVTLEDPIEYHLDGLTQVQVQRKAGLGFATALRAVLRQDPDVIMVGELRDRETVEIAMAAAMTGHLVLSTLHTNDAPSAATRLMEMGAPAYLISAGLIGVLAQRLARRLCEHCATRRPARPDELRAIGQPSRPTLLFDANSCRKCDGTGYRGRIGVFELLVVDPRVRELLLRRASTGAIREVARARGMRTLAQDAWSKVRAGWTTLAEVRPLLSLLADEAPACASCGAAIRAAFRACPSCGASLRRACACGAGLEAGWRFCPRCGESAALTAPAEPTTQRADQNDSEGS